MRLSFLFILILINNWLIAQSDWQQIQVDVVYLASDDLEGRATGSNGEKLAASYVASRLSKLGIQAKGDNGWYQTFDFSSNPHGGTKTDLKGSNVVGFLDRKADKTIVIGAHMDHLGHGVVGSLAANDHSIHNGADDNASGVAALLWLAEQLAKKENLGVNVLFIAFSAEEYGLFGSKAFCEKPTIALESVSAMINMDMVGRLKSDKGLAISGVGTSTYWRDALNKVKPSDINYVLTESGVGPSDHTSFYLKNIPVLHFFTGTHTDYHKPTDDSPLVNYAGILQISNLIYNLVLNIQNYPSMNFQKTKDESKETAASFKVTLGVMPDYTYSEKGMRIDAVLDDRPAKIAGLEGGDIIIKIGEFPVEDIYAYMKALGKFEKGKSTDIVVKRKGEEKTFKVTF
ncbi:MAG TPA: M20/M25/M40 family metallo-hydrolase [Saprospiraceae bacterium]|nr:M20/M25/M40 family metallo-hydrolase [Saprospiraceae bacterium]